MVSDATMIFAWGQVRRSCLKRRRFDVPLRIESGSVHTTTSASWMAAWCSASWARDITIKAGDAAPLQFVEHVGIGGPRDRERAGPKMVECNPIRNVQASRTGTFFAMKP